MARILAAADAYRSKREPRAHRPELAAEDAAAHLRRTSMTGAPLRMRLPVVRLVTFRVMVPFFCRRGLRNLVRAAARARPGV
ncbi:hypothetical protein [Dactylosporangium sp. CA-139066]|uniref:hypothetical protein n=1 Tax=Dactylosporangium sp. CA-139066 TaxID=3239930 RepID=UPI003D933B57